MRLRRAALIFLALLRLPPFRPTSHSPCFLKLLDLTVTFFDGFLIVYSLLLSGTKSIAGYSIQRRGEQTGKSARFQRHSGNKKQRGSQSNGIRYLRMPLVPALRQCCRNAGAPTRVNPWNSMILRC